MYKVFRNLSIFSDDPDNNEFEFYDDAIELYIDLVEKATLETKEILKAGKQNIEIEIYLFDCVSNDTMDSWSSIDYEESLD
jgi:hypothetical protein